MFTAETDPAADEKDFLCSSDTEDTLDPTYRFLEFSSVHPYLSVDNLKQQLVHRKDWNYSKH